MERFTLGKNQKVLTDEQCEAIKERYHSSINLFNNQYVVGKANVGTQIVSKVFNQKPVRHESLHQVWEVVKARGEIKY